MTFGSSSATTGYRYYFSVLAGICRGPVDEIFLIKSDGKTFWDGSYRAALNEGDRDAHDPDKPDGFDELATAVRHAGPITGNETLVIAEPDVYGGEKSEGGIVGLLSIYMGAKTQVIAAGDYIKRVMTGLRLSDFRGVVTAFFDGEVCANNPYPKAWEYRIRRCFAGWDGDVWYPDRALIRLTDPAIPAYTRGSGDTGITTVSTVIYGNVDGNITSLTEGASTLDATVTTVSSTYTGAEVNTYSTTGGTTTVYAVPLEYNDIYAMNPAHIIYECATNRDWGRGLDRALVDNVSFTDAANTLHDEGFGLCFKWSRSEDVDTFVQTVLDHIGGVVYTDKLTGLLCLRLVRGGYLKSNLSVFDYNSGLLEVSSTETAANDVVANEVIVKYRSPVLDADKEARQQNIASMDSLGCVYSTTRDYSGLPTSTLALRVAARDLKILSGGWRKVECKLDRRAYALNPGDVIVINAPDRKLDNLIVRVATVEESKIDDGSITISGAQDIFGLPDTPMTVQQGSEFLEPNRSPFPITAQVATEATYRDVYRLKNGPGDASLQLGATAGYVKYLASKPTSMSLSFTLESSVSNVYAPNWVTFLHQWTLSAASSFSYFSVLKFDISTTDTVIAVVGDLRPQRVDTNQALLINTPYRGPANSPRYEPYQEIVRLDVISYDSATGITYLQVGRGCNDSPAIPHKAGARVWVYDEVGVADPTEYVFGDYVVEHAFNHTTLGDAKTAIPVSPSPTMAQRIYKPYSGADFRVNGYPRDATPALTGDLTLTWKHRNRLTIEDQLVSEDESGALSPEDGTNYDIYIEGTKANGHRAPIYTYMHTGSGPNFTGNSLVITEAELRAADVADGPMWIYLSTTRPFTGSFAPGKYEASRSWRAPSVRFYYGVEPVVSLVGTGFDYNFDLDFDGV